MTSDSQISNLESPIAPSARRWTFDEVWAAEFEPAVRAKIRETAERRSDAFSESTLTVCGEEIRQMTPSDLLVLDGFESPFVCASDLSTVTMPDVLFFIWQLHRTNRHEDTIVGAYLRGRVFGRLRKRDLGECAKEISRYCERMFADFAPAAPPSDSSPESAALSHQPSIHFLAPLLVSVAKEIGHIDPVSGRLLADIPLPRLVQYHNAAQPSPESGDDLSRLRSECLARLNQLNAS